MTAPDVTRRDAANAADSVDPAEAVDGAEAAPPGPPSDEPPDGDGDGGDDGGDQGNDGGDGGGWGGGEPRWVRPAVIVGAVLALLLLGGAGGLLVGLHNAPGDLSVPQTGSVDVGFAQDMTVHHQQAVDMANWERDHTTDPALRQLAFDIESTQTAQIGRMQGWLALWGQPAQHSGGYMQWMVGAPAHEHGPTVANDGVAAMPGMATENDLRRLRASTGTELDVLFLQLMLRHHEGGVGMLDYGARYAQVPDVRNLASQMLSSQASESHYMTQLLAERGAQPLPVS